MGMFDVEVEPGEVGFDAGRLSRIDRHFERYVDDGRLAGWLAVVSRRGMVAHIASYGHRDRENDLPIERDTLFRIFSMTKPITSVAAMMLAEEGRFELKDPVSRFIPAFADQRVYRSGGLAPDTEPVAEPMRIWHLLTHTSGLTYGFHHAHPIDEQYRNAGFELGSPPGLDTAGCVAAWAGIPAGDSDGDIPQEGLLALRRAYREWPLLATLLDNAEMSLAKTDRAIAARYLALSDRPDLTERVLAEYDLTRRLVLAVTEHDRLVANRSVLSRAIVLRDPYVDALSYLQLRALAALRSEDADATDRTALERVLLLTVSGIAAGLQNTG